MIKDCANCSKSFETFDSRYKSCSKSCAKILRSKTQIERLAKKFDLNKQLDVGPREVIKLPPPEELPAPYAKRVHDMWAALVGEVDLPTRIA